VENPFENTKPSQEDKAIEKNIKALVEISAKLLKNPDYEKYKKLYYSFRERVYAFLIENPETDAQKFTVESKVLLGKLSVLELLIKEIENDAQIVKRRAKK
jgi:competence CoiA-like predicted nuclease